MHFTKHCFNICLLLNYITSEHYVKTKYLFFVTLYQSDWDIASLEQKKVMEYTEVANWGLFSWMNINSLLPYPWPMSQRWRHLVELSSGGWFRRWRCQRYRRSCLRSHWRCWLKVVITGSSAEHAPASLPDWLPGQSQHGRCDKRPTTERFENYRAHWQAQTSKRAQRMLLWRD